MLSMMGYNERLDAMERKVDLILAKLEQLIAYHGLMDVQSSPSDLEF